MWTKRSYDALYLWVAGQKELAARIMLLDGLRDEVAALETMPNLGVWYRMTRVAADAVGPKIVEQSAREAESELNRMVR